MRCSAVVGEKEYYDRQGKAWEGRRQHLGELRCCCVLCAWEREREARFCPKKCVRAVVCVVEDVWSRLRLICACMCLCLGKGKP